MYLSTNSIVYIIIKSIKNLKKKTEKGKGTKKKKRSKVKGCREGLVMEGKY